MDNSSVQFITDVEPEYKARISDYLLQGNTAVHSVDVLHLQDALRDGAQLRIKLYPARINLARPVQGTLYQVVVLMEDTVCYDYGAFFIDVTDTHITLHQLSLHITRRR